MSFGHTRIMTTLRSAALATALGLGVAVSGPVAAQDTTTPEDDPVTAETDEGFDDWGLLGLLGLAGLAGLRKRDPEVRTVDRTVDGTSGPRV